MYRLFRSLLERLPLEDDRFAQHRDIDLPHDRDCGVAGGGRAGISRSPDGNGNSVVPREDVTIATQQHEDHESDGDDGANTAIPMTFDRLDASSVSGGNFQTAPSYSGDQLQPTTTTHFDLLESMLDPFMSLQSLDWYGQHTEPPIFLETGTWA